MKDKVEFERLLAPAEASAYLGVDVKTLARYARAGKLPAYRTAGKHRRYKQADLDAIRTPDDTPLHKPYPHPGFGQACHACSVKAGVPVAAGNCGVRQ